MAHKADLISSLMFLLGGGCVIAVGAWTRSLLRKTRNDQLRLDMALATGNMAGWNWDPATDEIRFSANAAELFGTTWTHAQQTFEVGHPDDRDRARQVVERALESGDEYEFLSRMHRADTGELRWIQTRGHVHRDADGKVVHVSGVTADVTELALAQEQLREESRRKDAFLATLAHELRNPLAPIRYATSLLGDKATPLQRQRAREVIDRQSAHMTRLLDDLLDISRITRDVIELKLEVVDLRQAVEHAAENARNLFAQRRQRFEVQVPDRPILIRADATRIQQVLGNVLDNASKYTPQGGHVGLSLERRGTEALVRVRDDGIGIAPQDQQRIFELFAQVDASGQSPGLGIGLALESSCMRNSPIAPRTWTNWALAVVVLTGTTGLNFVVQPLVEFKLPWLVYFPALVFTALVAGLGPATLLLVGALLAGMTAPSQTRLLAVTGWGRFRDDASDVGFDMHLVKPVDPAEPGRAVAPAGGH